MKTIVTIHYDSSTPKASLLLENFKENAIEETREEIAINAMMEGVPLKTIAKTTHLSIQTLALLKMIGPR